MRARRLLLVPLLLLVAVTSQAGTAVPRSPADICDELPRRPVEAPLVTVEECGWECQAAKIQTDYIRWDPACCTGGWPLWAESGTTAAATAFAFSGGCY